MKRRLAICCATALALGVSNGIAAENEKPSVPDSPQALAEAENQFFVDHPDLKDEGEVVDEASKQLAAEGFVAKDVKDASETLAARTRSLLAERTPGEWQRKAVSLFPALGVAGSEFNALFLKHYNEMKVATPAFLQEPSWPVLLAQRCDDELHSRAAKAAPAATQPTAAAAPSVRPTVMPSAPGPRATESESHSPTSQAMGFWLETFGIFLAVLFASVPWVILYRRYLSQYFIRRSQPRRVQPDPQKVLPQPRENRHRENGEAPAWRVAMRPALVVFLIASVPAFLRTLAINGDLGMGERLFVSIAVGVLFGLLITLPFYAMDALWHAYQKHHHTVRHAGH